MKCPYCDYKCKRKNVLSRHLNKYHLDENDKKDIQCETCGKAFYKLESLRRHLKKKNCESKIQNIPDSDMKKETIIDSIPHTVIDDALKNQQEELLENKEIITYIETNKRKARRPFLKWLAIAGVVFFIGSICHNKGYVKISNKN
jgi:uncharacterized C2H2 Zn-finger protein